MGLTGRVIRADQVEMEEISWLWRNHFPLGMGTLVAGKPGEGKSLMMAMVAADITKRGENVIFSNMEDPLAQVVRPRLEAAGAKLSRIHFWTPFLPRDLDQLATEIQQVKATAVILDPISAHLSVSIYNDQEVRQALSPISALCAELNVGLVAVHHTIKNTSKATHPLSAVGGSGGGLPGAARAVYLFGVNPDDRDERALAPIKFNLGPAPKTLIFEMDNFEFMLGEGEDARLLETGRLVLNDDTSNLTATKMIASTAVPGTKAGQKEAKKLAIACEFVTNYLALGPRPVNEMREDALHHRLSWMTLRRAGEIVEVQPKRIGFGKGAYYTWQLPDGHPALVVDNDEPAPDEGAEMSEGDDA